jgi:hypothetical protein
VGTGLNSFTLTAKRWIEATNAIGIVSKSDRYGGTYAHKDIAFQPVNRDSIYLYNSLKNPSFSSSFKNLMLMKSSGFLSLAAGRRLATSSRP